MALLKVPISIDDPDFLDKCNSKLCYVCGDLVSTYEKLLCVCGDKDCPLCKDSKPANIPACDNDDCITKQNDKPPAKVTPKDI